MSKPVFTLNVCQECRRPRPEMRLAGVPASEVAVLETCLAGKLPSDAGSVYCMSAGIGGLKVFQGEMAAFQQEAAIKEAASRKKSSKEHDPETLCWSKLAPDHHCSRQVSLFHWAWSSRKCECIPAVLSRLFKLCLTHSSVARLSLCPVSSAGMGRWNKGDVVLVDFVEGFCLSSRSDPRPQRIRWGSESVPNTV